MSSQGKITITTISKTPATYQLFIIGQLPPIVISPLVVAFTGRVSYFIYSANVGENLNICTSKFGIDLYLYVNKSLFHLKRPLPLKLALQ
jgi:hypothetical protein